jgi:hypothetical protein
MKMKSKPAAKIRSVTGRISRHWLAPCIIFLLTLATAACGQTPPEPGAIPPPATSSPTESIPESIKGYEMSVSYWEEEWYFTLSPGLNVTRPCEKRSDSPAERFPRYTVKGVDGLKQVLSRLPRGEHLFMCPFERPDQPIVEEIETLSQQLGINLATMAPAESR